MRELFQGPKWRIVIHKCKAPETGYWGEVPAMPGCVSEGETEEECRANVLDAARGCLECYIEAALEKIAAPSQRAMAFA